MGSFRSRMWMSRGRSWPIVFLCLMVGGSPRVLAGGPLRVDTNGQAYRWDMSRPIRYSVAPGPLGSRSHDWAVAAIAQAVRTVTYPRVIRRVGKPPPQYLNE